MYIQINSRARCVIEDQQFDVTLTCYSGYRVVTLYNSMLGHRNVWLTHHLFLFLDFVIERNPSSIWMDSNWRQLAMYHALRSVFWLKSA